MSKLLIVIPAHNEEANIVQVVEELTRDYPQYDYVSTMAAATKRRPSAAPTAIASSICRSTWGWRARSRPGCALPPKMTTTAPCRWTPTASISRNISKLC